MCGIFLRLAPDYYLGAIGRRVSFLRSTCIGTLFLVRGSLRTPLRFGNWASLRDWPIFGAFNVLLSLPGLLAFGCKLSLTGILGIRLRVRERPLIRGGAVPGALGSWLPFSNSSYLGNRLLLAGVFGIRLPIGNWKILGKRSLFGDCPSFED